MLTRDELSNRTRSLTTIRATSGVVRPATQSSRVVLPAPDAPNKMVKPGGASKSTSRLNSGSAGEPFSNGALQTSLSRRNWRSDYILDGMLQVHCTLFYGIQQRRSAIQAVNHGEQDEAKHQ